LLVTSSRPSEGKSTTAANLARTFAELGIRVLVIDADLRKPSLHQFFECDESKGLTNYLTGSARPPEVFQSTDLPNLTLMASGPLPPNPAELLGGPKMLSLLAVASQKFDLVVVDGPPIAGLADAPLLGSMTAGTLLIVEASRTRRKVAQAALKRLQFSRSQIVGIVLNKLDVSKASHNYGYGYGYGYGDKAYYGYGADSPAKLTHNSDERA
jgi:capsular exopolysaccharide synthesis family protein